MDSGHKLVHLHAQTLLVQKDCGSCRQQQTSHGEVYSPVPRVLNKCALYGYRLWDAGMLCIHSWAFLATWVRRITHQRPSPYRVHSKRPEHGWLHRQERTSTRRLGRDHRSHQHAREYNVPAPSSYRRSEQAGPRWQCKQLYRRLVRHNVQRHNTRKRSQALRHGRRTIWLSAAWNIGFEYHILGLRATCLCSISEPVIIQTCGWKHSMDTWVNSPVPQLAQLWLEVWKQILNPSVTAHARCRPRNASNCKRTKLNAGRYLPDVTVSFGIEEHSSWHPLL